MQIQGRCVQIHPPLEEKLDKQFWNIVMISPLASSQDW
jgi:hypothetical protein